MSLAVTASSTAIDTLPTAIEFADSLVEKIETRCALTGNPIKEGDTVVINCSPSQMGAIGERAKKVMGDAVGCVIAKSSLKTHDRWCEQYKMPMCCFNKKLAVWTSKGHSADTFKPVTQPRTPGYVKPNHFLDTPVEFPEFTKVLKNVREAHSELMKQVEEHREEQRVADPQSGAAIRRQAIDEHQSITQMMRDYVKHGWDKDKCTNQFFLSFQEWLQKYREEKEAVAAATTAAAAAAAAAAAEKEALLKRSAQESKEQADKANEKANKAKEEADKAKEEAEVERKKKAPIRLGVTIAAPVNPARVPNAPDSVDCRKRKRAATRAAAQASRDKKISGLPEIEKAVRWAALLTDMPIPFQMFKTDRADKEGGHLNLDGRLTQATLNANMASFINKLVAKIPNHNHAAAAAHNWEELAQRTDKKHQIIGGATPDPIENDTMPPLTKKKRAAARRAAEDLAEEMEEAKVLPEQDFMYGSDSEPEETEPEETEPEEAGPSRLVDDDAASVVSDANSEEAAAMAAMADDDAASVISDANSEEAAAMAGNDAASESEVSEDEDE